MASGHFGNIPAESCDETPVKEPETSTPTSCSEGMWYRQDMQNRLSNLFGIDPRSLAAFRIGLGILLLADLLIRATDLEAHYTDAGVVPRDILLQRMPHSKWLSCHLLGGSATFEACLFLVAAILAIGVMVGYRTRIAVVASWAMLVSLQTRNTLVLNGGDVLLRMLIFWAMFLPLNMCWSIDSRHRSRRKTLAILSPASAAILIHVCVMYWMTGMFKLEGWLETKDAFAQVIGFQSYSKPFVRELLQYPRFVHWMGYGVLTLELLGPAIVFCPFGTKLLRIIVAAAFVCLHLGIEVSLTVGLFTYVSWLAWLLFLPDVFWNTLASWMSTSNYDWVGRADAADSDRLSGADAFKTKLPQRMLNCGLCLVLAYVLVWNVSTARKPWNDAVRDYTPAVLNDLLLVRQQWNMFTRPSTYDGWFVMVARLKDGRVLDLLRDGQPADWNSFSKPDWIYRRYPNHRWRKMYRNIAIGRADAFLSPLCNYAALRWNRLHSAEAAVQKIELHFMQQMGLEPELQDTFMQRILHQEEILNPASALRLDIGWGFSVVKEL